MSTTESPLNTASMTDQTLLAKARKARFDDLPNFSGRPSEDVERFLKSIKNITKATDASDNHSLLEIVRGKLTQSAGIWFDNNESSFTKWSDFETAFRNRYFPTTIDHQNFGKLRQRKQQHDETVTAYIDDVVDLCRTIDSEMSDKMIIQYLMSGLNPDFKKELSRHESSMITLTDFLKYAKLEQDLYDTFEQSRSLSLDTQQPSFNFDRSAMSSLTTRVAPLPPRQYYNRKPENRFPHSTSTPSFVPKWNSAHTPQHRPSAMTDNTKTRQYPPKSNFPNKLTHNQSATTRPFSNCKVCGRTNHRTIDCFYKRATGCFNCGQHHNVRACTLPPNFQ